MFLTICCILQKRFIYVMSLLDKWCAWLFFGWWNIFGCFIFGIFSRFIMFIIFQFRLLILHSLDNLFLNNLNSQFIKMIDRTKLNSQLKRIVKRLNLQYVIIILTQLNFKWRHIFRLSKLLFYSLYDKKHTELTG